MDFALSEEQEALADAAGTLVREVADDQLLIRQFDAPTGHMPDVWRVFAEGGWFGLAIPQEYGGAGLPPGDVAVVLEQFGAGPLPALFAINAVLSPLVILETGSADQKTAMLARVAEGAERVTVAITERDYGWSREKISATLTPSGSGFVLNGEKTFVPDAGGATKVLVAAKLARADRIVVVMVDTTAAGVTTSPLQGFISWQSNMRFENVQVAAAEVLGGEDAWPGLWRAICKSIPLLCAYQVGSAQAVFELALNHTRTRIQFGQPIGRFQRVQDHTIEILNSVDAARWTTNEAIWKLEKGSPSLLSSIHLAKSVVSDGHWEACNYAHEVHAGLGADLKYGLAKHTYLSRSLYHFLGEPRWHRKLMTRELGW